MDLVHALERHSSEFAVSLDPFMNIIASPDQEELITQCMAGIRSIAEHNPDSLWDLCNDGLPIESQPVFVAMALHTQQWSIVKELLRRKAKSVHYRAFIPFVVKEKQWELLVDAVEHGQLECNVLNDIIPMLLCTYNQHELLARLLRMDGVTSVMDLAQFATICIELQHVECMDVLGAFDRTIWAQLAGFCVSIWQRNDQWDFLHVMMSRTNSLTFEPLMHEGARGVFLAMTAMSMQQERTMKYLEDESFMTDNVLSSFLLFMYSKIPIQCMIHLIHRFEHRIRPLMKLAKTVIAKKHVPIFRSFVDAVTHPFYQDAERDQPLIVLFTLCREIDWEEGSNFLVEFALAWINTQPPETIHDFTLSWGLGIIRQHWTSAFDAMMEKCRISPENRERFRIEAIAKGRQEYMDRLMPETTTIG